MTFLAPWFLLGGLAVAAGVVLVHLIALQRPPAAVLPTARFVPDVPARATSRASRPTDRLLLLLRVLAVLLAALAFARPVRLPERAALRQVIVADRSRALASADELRDRLGAVRRPGDVVVLVDSTARLLGAGDSLPALERVERRGALSAGLVLARRAAAALRDSTDSVRVVVLSPLAEESLDAAAPAVRATWPGAIEVVRLTARRDSASPAPLDVRADADDPVAVAAAFLGAAPAEQPTRLLRGDATTADSAWARETGGLLLVWPDSLPAGWRAASDTIGALSAGRATLVAPFVRTARAPANATPAAWWVDGAAAATETPLGAGCVRTVGLSVGAAGDLPLRPAFHALLRALLAPCGGARAYAAAPDSALAWLRGGGSTIVAQTRDAATRSPLVPWLLGAALLLLLVETAVRSTAAPREAAA